VHKEGKQARKITTMMLSALYCMTSVRPITEAELHSHDCCYSFLD